MGLHHPHADASPLNPVPAVVWAMVGVVAGAEAVFQLADAGIVARPGLRTLALQWMGFYEPLWSRLIETGSPRIDDYWRFVSYPLVHQGPVHAGFACVLMLALGNFCARVFPPLTLVTTVLLAVVAGAVVFGLTAGRGGVLFGAYPGVYGLIGLFTWCLWVRAAGLGSKRYQAFTLIGVIVAFQVFFAVIEGRWAWLFAELAGFAAGFALAPLAAPGGFRRMRDRMRAR